MKDNMIKDPYYFKHFLEIRSGYSDQVPFNDEAIGTECSREWMLEAEFYKCIQ